MKKIGTAIIVATLIILAVTGSWYFLNLPHSPSASDPVTLGLQPVDASGLVYIAQDRGFFSQNGLNVTIRDFDPPIMGVSAMLDGKLDLAGSTEYPVVVKAFGRENFSVLTKYVQLQSVSLVGRKDHGIENISDLRGKKIGVTRGTLAEFYLGRFLTIHGMDLQDVTLVDVQPSQFMEAITAGTIDALVCYEPYLTEVRARMDGMVIEWSANSAQPTFGVLVARNDWIAGNPDRAVRFLKSLDMAVEYTGTHPAESRAIVQKRLNLSDTYLNAEWPKNQFGLSLDQSLVLAMEDEARWMIANNMTTSTTVPDFRNYIYTKALESEKPGSVNIIS
jgi:NitT/TauT family transport system substrate-binding protein